MKKKGKLKSIMEVKLRDNTPESVWHKDRLDKCLGCKFNSKNKINLSPVDLAAVALNGGKDTCTLCGCGVVDKTSSPTEACALEDHLDKGEVMWNRLEVVTSSSDNIDIINNSSDEYNIDLVNSDLVIYMGKVKPKSTHTFSFSIKPKVGSLISKIDVTPGCSCTVPSITDEDGSKRVNIEFVAGRIDGSILKRGLVKYTVNKKEFNFKLMIKGFVDGKL